MNTRLAILLLLPLGALVAGLSVLLSRVGVRRRHLDRFARRHRWSPTETGLPIVAGALSVIFRWRRTGLAAGLVLGLSISIAQGRLSLDFLSLFLGWFAGALIAEWRLPAPVAESARRGSTLTTRELRSFLSPVALGLVGGVGALLVAAAVAAFVADLRGGQLGGWLGWAIVTLLTTAALVATTRHVLDRPQGYTDPGLRDADDAVRSHSLTVIAGCAVAAAGTPIAEFVDRAWPDWGYGVLFLFVLLLLGWWVASWSPSRRASAAPSPAPGPAGAGTATATGARGDSPAGSGSESA